MKSIEIIGNCSGSADKGRDKKSSFLLDFTSIYAQFISVICSQNIETLRKYCLRESGSGEPSVQSFSQKFKTTLRKLRKMFCDYDVRACNIR